jgi:hypothetical protein
MLSMAISISIPNVKTSGLGTSVISNKKEQKIIWTNLTPAISPSFNNTKEVEGLTKIM